MKLFYFSGNGGDSVDRLAKKTQKQNKQGQKLVQVDALEALCNTL